MGLGKNFRGEVICPWSLLHPILYIPTWAKNRLVPTHNKIHLKKGKSVVYLNIIIDSYASISNTLSILPENCSLFLI